MFGLDGEVFLWILCWPLPKGQEIREQLIQVNADNLSMSFTVLLSLGLPLFIVSFSYFSVQYFCFGASMLSR